VRPSLDRQREQVDAFGVAAEAPQGVELFQLVVTTERDKRRVNQDRLRALHADHPGVEIFCGHNPFEYLDLVEKSGGTPRGISPTHRLATAGRR
jgi:hypothetical protein